MDQGVGREVKRLREERNWSQAKLAVEADMSVSGVSMIENGQRNLTTTTLAKLAGALGVEVPDLFPKAQAPQLPLEDAGQRSGLFPWAAHIRQVARRIQDHADDPDSPAFRDVFAALFFVEESNRETGDLYELIVHEGLLGEEPFDATALDELTAAFEALGFSLGVAKARARIMEIGRTESELGRARRRVEEAAAKCERGAEEWSRAASG